MTKKEFRKRLKEVGMPEYKYELVKATRIRSIDYPPNGHFRTFLGDSAVTSNTIGKKDDRVLKMFCRDADWGEICQY